jgi:signal transduction histidine kinase
MINQVRNRLTLLYTGIMALSLLGFIFISYFSLSMQLMKEQKEEVLRLAQNETAAHMNWFVEELEAHKDNQTNFSPSHRSIDVPGNIFYFFVDLDGRARNINEPIEEQEVIYREASQWSGISTDILRVATSDGRIITVAVAAYPVYLDNQLIGILYAGKNLEAYSHFLNRLVQVLSIFLGVFSIIVALAGHLLANRAMIPICRSLERQRQFVDDASHELRTPLSIVLASLEVIGRKERGKLSAFSSQLLGDIKDEISRLSRLAGDLLTLARADSGTVEIDRTVFDFRVEVERVIRNFGQQAQTKDIVLTFSSPEEIRIYADRERLVQLFTLLLDNALKYTPTGGSVYVTLAIQEDDTTRPVQLSVRDTGIGISASDIEKIFERFYRVDQSRTRQSGGFGLGLAIAKWIVKAHGGSINVVSEYGKGSNFIVMIPTGEKFIRQEQHADKITG